jgi:hypothetical protein
VLFNLFFFADKQCHTFSSLLQLVEPLRDWEEQTFMFWF